MTRGVCIGITNLLNLFNAFRTFRSQPIDTAGGFGFGQPPVPNQTVLFVDQSGFSDIQIQMLQLQLHPS